MCPNETFYLLTRSLHRPQNLRKDDFNLIPQMPIKLQRNWKKTYLKARKMDKIYPQLRSYVCRDEISLLVLHVNINLIKIKALQYAIPVQRADHRPYKEERIYKSNDLSTYHETEPVNFR